MMKKIKIFFLIIAFVFSLDFIWDCIYVMDIRLLGEPGTIVRDRYAFQVASALLYLNFSIFFTGDGEKFLQFLVKHRRFGIMMEAFLQLMSWLVHFAILLPSEMMFLESTEDDKMRIEMERAEIISRTKRRYIESKKYPMVMRFILANMMIVLPVTILGMILPEMAMKVTSGTSVFVAIIGMIFICANCNDEALR